MIEDHFRSTARVPSCRSRNGSHPTKTAQPRLPIRTGEPKRANAKQVKPEALNAMPKMVAITGITASMAPIRR